LPPTLVLASASPRRARLLRELGLEFEVVVSQVDESLHPGESGERAAERLAREKALAVASRTALPVLAADTVVLCEGELLGKPSSPEDARRMLRRLAGQTHEVVTGVCLARDGHLLSACERTAVRLAALSPAEIDWYVATGEPLDKAGAYHVDGLGALFIEGVTGSPSNVAGLPLRLVYALAAELGLRLGPPLPPPA
jgi:septum formation protein